MSSTKRTPLVRRKQVRKEESIRIRVTSEQKNMLVAAAATAGLGVSGWLLMLGLREVARVDKGGG